MTWTHADSPSLTCETLNKLIQATITTPSRDLNAIPLTLSLSTTMYTIGENLEGNVIFSEIPTEHKFYFH
jgi:hypothetical protein